MIDDYTMSQIKSWTNKLYYLATNEKEMTRADQQGTSDSHTPITMLTEVENVINGLQLEFDLYELEDKNVFNQE